MSLSSKKKMKSSGDIGLIGLAVMGENLILNMESKGFHVVAYNRTTSKVDEFLAGRAQGKKISGAYSLEELVSMLAAPRKIMIMVRAGAPVDAVIEALLPLLSDGDVLIDGGNSHFRDTERRRAACEAAGRLFIGAGVSGGEEGALLGPSIMPGGSPAAWPHVKPIFQAIAAKTKDGTPCCDWVGEGGAGHFVKTLHNGNEYSSIEVLIEAYNLMRTFGLSNEEMHEVFAGWNRGRLESYLVEITADILGKRADDDADVHVVDRILDVAGAKGTGKWTAENALDMGVPAPTVAEAVFARCLSALKDERVAAARMIAAPPPQPPADHRAMLEDLEAAVYAATIVAFAQGFAQIRQASKELSWNVDYGGTALLWREGCIIRSRFLSNIKEAFDKDADLPNLMLDDFFRAQLEGCHMGWRRIVCLATMNGVPVPALASALSYYDGYRSERLPANLLQAQRDYFGAHTYERVDKPRGEFFHTNWTGRGGTTSSTTYNV